MSPSSLGPAGKEIGLRALLHLDDKFNREDQRFWDPVWWYWSAEDRGQTSRGYFVHEQLWPLDSLVHTLGTILKPSYKAWENWWPLFSIRPPVHLRFVNVPALDKASLAIWSHAETQKISVGVFCLLTLCGLGCALRNSGHIVPFGVPPQRCLDAYSLFWKDALHAGYVWLLYPALILQSIMKMACGQRGRKEACRILQRIEWTIEHRRFSSPQINVCWHISSSNYPRTTSCLVFPRGLVRYCPKGEVFASSISEAHWLSSDNDGYVFLRFRGLFGDKRCHWTCSCCTALLPQAPWTHKFGSQALMLKAVLEVRQTLEPLKGLMREDRISLTSTPPRIRHLPGQYLNEVAHGLCSFFGPGKEENSWHIFVKPVDGKQGCQLWVVGLNNAQQSIFPVLPGYMHRHASWFSNCHNSFRLPQNLYKYWHSTYWIARTSLNCVQVFTDRDRCHVLP